MIPASLTPESVRVWIELCKCHFDPSLGATFDILSLPYS